jgi:hypothetical protein
LLRQRAQQLVLDVLADADRRDRDALAAGAGVGGDLPGIDDAPVRDAVGQQQHAARGRALQRGEDSRGAPQVPGRPVVSG